MSPNRGILGYVEENMGPSGHVWLLTVAVLMEVTGDVVTI